VSISVVPEVHEATITAVGYLSTARPQRSEMANSFGTDIIIQVPQPKVAAKFYVDVLGFEVTDEEPMISLRGEHINLFIEQGPELGPVLEVTVDDVDEARRTLIENGCTLVKDEPAMPRCYVKDSFGLTYNLTT
jgi:hypothetical protein